MRPFELTFAAAILLFCFLLRFRSLQRQKHWQALALFFLALILILHLLIEDLRWQMVPAYFSLFLLGSTFFRKRSFNQIRMNRISSSATMLTCAGLALAILVPVATLPAPTGPFKVGTANYSLIDSSRDEIFSGNDRQKRSLPIQVWYPAEAGSAGSNLHERENEVGVQYMQASSDFVELIKAPLPSVLASHLHLIRTHSLKDPPIANSKAYPVIIFSHGLMGGRIQNTILCENLASHGFVVVGIDHTYDAAFSIFPTGKTVCSQLLTGIQKGPTIQRNGFEVRIRDVRSVLDCLPKMNESKANSVANLDLQNIGVLGHSFGGATSLAVLALDPRVKAAIDMDGTTVGVPASCKPVLIMQADHGDRDPLVVTDFEKRQKGSIFRMRILNTGHANFTDLPTLTPLHWTLLLSGSIEPSRCNTIINDFSLDFFKHYLKREPFRVISLRTIKGIKTRQYPDVEQWCVRQVQENEPEQ